MAWFRYQCRLCHKIKRVSLQARVKEMPCDTCGGTMRSLVEVGSARTVEVLDNGIMARKVERLHNVEEIMAERDAKHSNRAGESEDDG